jgi:hypothetical protein
MIVEGPDGDGVAWGRKEGWHAMSAPPTTAFSLPASVCCNHGFMGGAATPGRGDGDHHQPTWWRPYQEASSPVPVALSFCTAVSRPLNHPQNFTFFTTLCQQFSTSDYLHYNLYFKLYFINIVIFARPFIRPAKSHLQQWFRINPPFYTQ